MTDPSSEPDPNVCTNTCSITCLVNVYLNGRFVQMTQVRCGLPRLVTQHHHVGVNQPEGVDDDLRRKQKTPQVHNKQEAILKVLLAQNLTFPLTLWMGSTTTATARSDSASKLCCVLMSTPDNQQPKPGWLWYHPTTISGLETNRRTSWRIQFKHPPTETVKLKKCFKRFL